MKNKWTFLLLSLMGLTPAVSAQKTISEGTLTYDISIRNTSEKNAAGSTASLVVYLKGLYSRTDMISNLGSEKTILDSKNGTAAILKEYSGQKLMITLTKNNWTEKNKKAAGLSFVEQAEKMQILNYQCSKAVARLTDGTTLTVYYTKELLLQNKEYDPLFKNLAGVPLQYQVETGKLTLTYTINKIDQAIVPQNKFELPKAGYRVITYDDNKQGKKA
jgi:GLPGLI family protein